MFYSLPPTTDSFLQHIKCASLSTILMKSARIPVIPTIRYDCYSWSVCGTELLPVKMARRPFPKLLEKSVTCNCKKRCAGNCSCYKSNIPCYIACACKCEIDKCSRTEQFEIDTSDDDE